MSRITRPIYGNEIIVLVKFKKQFSWYLSVKEFWILDYSKWSILFSNADKKSPFREEVRRDLEVINRNNWSEFRERIKDKLVSKYELSNLILQYLPSSWNESAELFPSLYVDFDIDVLYSLYPEYTAFEKFVPDNWDGRYENFYDLIPESEKYWVIDGVNYLPTE